MPETWKKCGHPRTVENTVKAGQGRTRCSLCNSVSCIAYNARNKESITAQRRAFYVSNRIRLKEKSAAVYALLLNDPIKMDHKRFLWREYYATHPGYRQARRDSKFVLRTQGGTK